MSLVERIWTPADIANSNKVSASSSPIENLTSPSDHTSTIKIQKRSHKKTLTVMESLQRTVLEAKKPWCRNLFDQMMRKAKEAAKRGEVCIEFCQDRSKEISDLEIDFINTLLDKTGLDYDYDRKTKTFSLSWDI